MYRNKQRIPNLHPAKLIITTMRIAIAHFKNAAERRKALSKLDKVQRKQADTPLGLAALVKAKEVDERHINRLLLKIGGLSRTRPPKEVTPKSPLNLKLGKPFLTSDDGPVLLTAIAQAVPKGFRHPSTKAKNWSSTSLLERVCEVHSEWYMRSKRGEKKAVTDAETRELIQATQDVRNIPDRYLSRTQRALRASLPPLPKAATLDAIRERHALARGEEVSGGPERVAA